MSPTRSEATGKSGRYHHGDLRGALIDAAIELIAERGIREFSLAEASRRLGVSVAAPYRHFTDRDELLAAVALRALKVFTTMLNAETGAAEDPEQRLAAMARTYVRFAAEERPLFETLYNSGIDKRRYPELERAYEPIDAFHSLVTQICDEDTAAAEILAKALEASAHGHATLLVDGGYGQGPDAVRVAVDRAAAATFALIAGRKALSGTEERRASG